MEQANVSAMPSSQLLVDKRLLLIAISFAGLAYFNITVLLILLIAIAYTYSTCYFVTAYPKYRAHVLPLSVALVALVFFGLRGYISLHASASALALGFVGFSFLVFRVIHVLFEVWRENMKAPTLKDLTLYLAFVPTYLAGPVELWKPFFENIEKPYDFELAKIGLWRILIALPIKFIFVDQVIVAGWLEKATKLLDVKLGVGAVFTFGFVNYLRAYFDLWSYSEVAIGVCALLGILMRENLNRPWAQTTIGEFWRSWHMSVTNWCTYHVFFPVFGRFRNAILATVSSMMVMALWHGTTLNWILWGVHHSVGLVFYAKMSRKFKKWQKNFSPSQKQVYKVACWFATQLYVVLGYFYVGNGIARIK